MKLTTQTSQAARAHFLLFSVSASTFRARAFKLHPETSSRSASRSIGNRRYVQLTTSTLICPTSAGQGGGPTAAPPLDRFEGGAEGHERRRTMRACRSSEGETSASPTTRSH